MPDAATLTASACVTAQLSQRFKRRLLFMESQSLRDDAVIEGKQPGEKAGLQAYASSSSEVHAMAGMERRQRQP